MSADGPALALPPGAASGVGSLPGTDPREAARLVVGELPDLPHLPELPERGPGSDLLGRTATHLVDLHVDLQPAGWRLVQRPGRDAARGRAALREDLDALEEAAQGYDGLLKVQLAGPWTLAAGVELPRGGAVLGDPGAARDLAASLAEAAAAHVAEVARRVPGARVVLQLDEPSLPAVLAGRVRTASGFSALRAVEEPDAEQALRGVVAAAGVPVVVHCCAGAPPVGVLRRAGAAGVGLNALAAGLLRESALDEQLGEALEAGVVLWAGVVPAVPAQGSAAAALSDPGTTVEPVRRLWRRLGLDPASLGGRVVATPTCGLAGAPAPHARAALAAARAAGRVLVDDPEG
ncbi:methionine synthase [Vallicoccus soli]|uniref:Methionine synthase n=1 Tax=Vallicoccus soli TaxID=2339232 RepID=A0A3A3ZAT9_9ACTN|nr:methionine synthase [Vallicoccus soli]RJK98206.1 methionine synthase [Vallicoccus soli]